MNAKKEKIWDKICSLRPKEKNKIEPKQWLLIHAVITVLVLIGLIFQLEYNTAYIFVFWGAIYFNLTIDLALWFTYNPPSDSFLNKILTFLCLIMFIPLIIVAGLRESYRWVMCRLNLKHLGDNPAIWWIYVLFDFTFGLIFIDVGYQTSCLNSDDPQKNLILNMVKVTMYFVMLIIFFVLRKLLLAGFKYGKNIGMNSIN